MPRELLLRQRLITIVFICFSWFYGFARAGVPRAGVGSGEPGWGGVGVRGEGRGGFLSLKINKFKSFKVPKPQVSKVSKFPSFKDSKTFDVC